MTRLSFSPSHALNLHSHPQGDSPVLAQSLIHYAEIQVNPLLPGAIPQPPEDPRREPHKHCDQLTVICLNCEPGSSSWPVCMVCKWSSISEERPTCSVACRANMHRCGKEASRETRRGGGQWGRTRNIFQRSKMQWQKMLPRLGPAFSGWTHNTWVGAG